MKKITLISRIVSIFFVTLLTNVVFSGEMDHSSHQHDSSQSEKTGKMIHHSTVESYKFMYHLIDMSGHVKNMPEMKGTNHLMVFIKDPQGKVISNAKVGYVVTGPDKSEQKVMTMAMSGGFGSDIKFKDKGMYNITTKALIGEKKLIDHFSYKIE